MLTNEQMRVITRWEAKLNQASILFDPNCPGNVSIVLGYIANNLGGDVSENNLSVAARACHAALRYLPGHAPPDPRADAKAKAETDARSLEASRQRELKTRAGINSDQTQITTEFDRCEELNKPRLAEGSNEMAAIAFQDLKDDETMAEVASRIDRHRPFPHSRGAKQREVLTKLRFDLVKQRQSPEKILKAIESKIQSFEDASVR
jgi:hypothetical protein